MAYQLPLELKIKPSSHLKKFIFGDDLYLKDLLEQQLSDNGELLIYLIGSPKSGKTHLLLGQCHAAQNMGMKIAYFSCSDIKNVEPEVLLGLDQLDFLAIDDIDKLAGDKKWEKSIFNLFNKAREANCRLLFSATKAATNITFSLEDLQSRLTWGITLKIKELSDNYKKNLLQNLAKRRGLDMSNAIANFLIDHHKRDNHSLQILIETLDHYSLAEKRKLSIPFVKERLKTL